MTVNNPTPCANPSCLWVTLTLSLLYVQKTQQFSVCSCVPAGDPAAESSKSASTVGSADNQICEDPHLFVDESLSLGNYNT